MIKYILFAAIFLFGCETTPEDCPEVECPECPECEDCDKYPNWGEIIKNICDCSQNQSQVQ